MSQYSTREETFDATAPGNCESFRYILLPGLSAGAVHAILREEPEMRLGGAFRSAYIKHTGGRKHGIIRYHDNIVVVSK